MAVKKWVKKFQPVTLYIMITLTTFYFLVQLAVSYITHALTLTVDSYLMLCNLIALLGCVFSIKYGGREEITQNLSGIQSSGNNSNFSLNECPLYTVAASPNPASQLPTAHCCGSASTVSSPCPTSERRLKNTFGWARIDVLVMLIGCVFFASLCFSVVLEACQTLLHISHQDEMHHPIPVFCVGVSGLILNGLCYLLIGGYTLHQGSFLHVTSSGAVILESALPSRTSASVNRCGVGLYTNKEARTVGEISKNKRQGPWEMCRDAIGCVLVMVCALVVYISEPHVAKYIDPVLAIISATLLLFLSYPYMKESCLILLQTIPNHINIDSLRNQLIKAFPDILNVHDLHVWQLTADKTICTAHIIFLNPEVYKRSTKDITDFFIEHGVTQVTIQPEFFKDSNCIDIISDSSGQCLVKCNNVECFERYCCDMSNVLDQLSSVEVIDDDEPSCFGKRRSHKSSPNGAETNNQSASSPKRLVQELRHILSSRSSSSSSSCSKEDVKDQSQSAVPSTKDDSETSSCSADIEGPSTKAEPDIERTSTKCESVIERTYTECEADTERNYTKCEPDIERTSTKSEYFSTELAVKNEPVVNAEIEVLTTIGSDKPTEKPIDLTVISEGADIIKDKC